MWICLIQFNVLFATEQYIIFKNSSTRNNNVISQAKDENASWKRVTDKESLEDKNMSELADCYNYEYNHWYMIYEGVN